jgi:hypothetical protein
LNKSEISSTNPNKQKRAEADNEVESRVKKRLKYVSEAETNPPVVIVPYEITKLDGKRITVNVIRDDLLIGGSKQRALIKFIEFYSEYDEFVYAGPSSGFAQVALTIACLKLNKTANLWIQNPNSKHEPKLTLLCEKIGAKVQIYSEEKLSTIEERVNLFVEKEKKEGKKLFLIPFGLDNEFYNKSFYEQLSQAIPNDLNPKRLWLTPGSGTLLRVLTQIWKTTEFMPVKVGRNLWPDQYTEDEWKRMGGQDRIDKLAAPQSFYQNAPNDKLPPYPSCANYDAKVWQHFLIYGEDGDYIWNVASEVELLKMVNNS